MLQQLKEQLQLLQDRKAELLQLQLETIQKLVNVDLEIDLVEDKLNGD